MRTTLNLEDDVLTAAKEIAADTGRPLGVVVSDLARRGLTPLRVVSEEQLPVIRVPDGSPPITPQMVRRALDED